VDSLGITIDRLEEDVVLVELTGALEFSRAYTFDEEMRRLESQRPRTMILDLRKLSFLDSAGIGRVLALQRRAKRDGRRLVVVRGSRAVQRLFAITAMDARLEMVSEPQAAMPALALA
jgi:anti-sigma B factor antagonist